jgi:hypothetical protein
MSFSGCFEFSDLVFTLSISLAVEVYILPLSAIFCSFEACVPCRAVSLFTSVEVSLDVLSVALSVTSSVLSVSFAWLVFSKATLFSSKSSLASALPFY